MSKLMGVYVDLSPKSPSRTYVLRRRMPHGGPREIYEVYSSSQKNWLVEGLLKKLALEKDNFYEALCAVDEKWCNDNSRRVHRYFSKNRAELLVEEKYIKEFEGYWLNTNPGTGGTKDLLQEACEAAAVSYGSLREIKIGAT